jgi:transposase
MVSYSKAAMERAMKVQEVILRAMAKRITWWQAAEIIGISERHMRRWRERYEAFGYDGLFDRRRGTPSPKRVPLAQVEQVLGLYREKYCDLNVRCIANEDPGVRCRACFCTSMAAAIAGSRMSAGMT